MALTQDQVNQLAREAAQKAGGSISYADALTAAKAYGITPEQVQAALSTGVITGADTTAISNSYLNANPDVKAEYEQFSQQDPAKWNPETYSAYHYLNYGANENRQGSEAIDSYLNNLTKQIMSTSDTSKWSGEGKGSAEANAKDMAGIMLGLGITDLKDFGQITDPTTGEKTFGNIKTGKAVSNTYGERQTGDAFGGTYSGKGNTGYRVQFNPDGSPVFYTSEQSSSSAKELAPILGIASMALGVPGLLGGAINSGLGLGLGAAGTGALGGAAAGGLISAATGGNVLKGAALGGLGGYASGSGMFGGATTGDMSIEDWANATGNYNPSLNLGIEDWAQINGNYQVDGGANVGTPNTPGYYNEITGQFIPDQNGGLQGPLDNTSGTNIGSMDGYSYDPTTQTWTSPDGTQTTSITGVTNGAVTGQDLLNSAGANVPSGGSSGGVSGAINGVAGTGLTGSQIANIAKVAVPLLAAGGAGAAAASSGGNKYDVVPVPSSWQSPTQPQTSAYPSLPPIDFGTPELLRGTQWEKYLSPRQTPAAPTPQTGMTYNQLQSILKGGTGTPPTLSNIISGIQSQYGQNLNSTMG